MSATHHDKSYCPKCHQSSRVIWKRAVDLSVIDEKSGRISKIVKFDQYRCKICKHEWQERSPWQ